MSTSRRVLLAGAALVVGLLTYAVWFFFLAAPVLPDDFCIYDRLDTTLLRVGDVAMRRGVSPESQAVIASDQKGQYSHTGIVCRRANRWCIVHAVPGEAESVDAPDRVKVSTLEDFFSPSRACAGAIFHYIIEADREALNDYALAKEGVLFDHEYDDADTTRLYCTEFVQFAYSHVGQDLSQGRRTHQPLPFLSSDVIMPSDIAANPNLQLFFDY